MVVTSILSNLSKIFYKTADSNIIIINDDFLNVDYIKPESIDLIVTSPPYNIGIKYENFADNIPYSKYLEFTEKWLSRCYELIKPDGRFCLNIPIDKRKGGIQTIYADILTIAKKVGWKYYGTIFWYKQFTSHKVWGSYANASSPSIISTTEAIILLYKKQWKKFSKGKSDITENEYRDWINDLWIFPGEYNRNIIGHPSPFPLELPKRCIKLFSYINDVVLDPFVGSGTTLIASYLLGRKAIGIDISRKYCETAKERLIKKAKTNIEKLTLFTDAT
jgi:site-specific DNA-methyltransferase (adenine-specific)